MAGSRRQTERYWKKKDYEPARHVIALHRNDPLVRIDEWHLKDIYKGKEKGSEVMQYLLIDGQIRGAVMGHFRYGPYDLHEIRTELSGKELEMRREEILEAVRSSASEPGVCRVSFAPDAEELVLRCERAFRSLIEDGTELRRLLREEYDAIWPDEEDE